MLEVYRHGARPSTFGSLPHHSHHSSALQPYRPIVNGFGGLGDWTDALLPRSSSSTATSFNVWELSPSKLRTAAVAFTFVVTAGYISLLAAGGKIVNPHKASKLGIIFNNCLSVRFPLFV